MKNKGIFASAEAMLSLLLLSSAILYLGQAEKPTMENLYILQKENDLLKIWAKEDRLRIDEMALDFEFAFPGKSGLVVLNEKEKSIGQNEKGRETIASEITLFDSGLKKTRIRLFVFK